MTLFGYFPKFSCCYNVAMIFDDDGVTPTSIGVIIPLPSPNTASPLTFPTWAPVESNI